MKQLKYIITVESQYKDSQNKRTSTYCTWNKTSTRAKPPEEIKIAFAKTPFLTNKIVSPSLLCYVCISMYHDNHIMSNL